MTQPGDTTTRYITLTYDSGPGANLLGRLAAVNDPSGLVQYSYDPHGHLATETRTINAVTFITGYSYDAAGHLRTITYPSGQTIEYLPDTTDPAKIAGVQLNPAGQPLAANIAYQPFGPVSSMTLGNNVVLSKDYDLNYQLIDLHQANGTALMDRTYTPDNVGNISAISDHLDATRSQSFGYDDLYRLTSASGIYGTIAYTYDKVGNRRSRTRTGTHPARDSYHYYAGTHRLRTVVGDHAELFTYDADGNTTTRTPGAANPQPAIVDPADYIYNSAGQRAIKAKASAVIYHYDQSGQLIAETDGIGNLIKAYVWLHGQPLAMIDADGSIYYYHNDHLGTPQKMTDANAQVVWAADYLPFGKADVIVATVENNLRFAGQYYDSETGLHYNWHRYYDPSLGRYLRADPIGLQGGINLYSYVSNNPVIKYDPMGLTECDKCSDCPNGKWDLDLGVSGTVVAGMGGSAADATFTCLSSGKKCKGKMYCALFGAVVDFGAGWNIDFGGGRTVTGKCNNSDIEYITEGWFVVTPLKLLSVTGSSNINVGIGLTLGGIGKYFCRMEYIQCDN